MSTTTVAGKRAQGPADPDRPGAQSGPLSTITEVLAIGGRRMRRLKRNPGRLVGITL